MERDHGICGLDFDILIDGQDWDLANFSLQQKQIKKHSNVAAHFTNLGGWQKNIFTFVSEKGKWKIDDIEAFDDNGKGKSESIGKLKEMLNDYDL